MKHIVIGNTSEKGEARLSLVGTRLPHKVGFQCEEFNPVIIGIREWLILRSCSPMS